MNTTYTYIQTHKSLYENQVLSCGSSSRGAENQTPSMWLEGRGIGPINPRVPYSAVTASNWSLATASQQHHGSFSTAGERDGGWAISETKVVCSQNRCKMGRSNPSSSHLLPRSSPSQQTDHALEKSAGGSFSQANAVGWYIMLMTIWVQVHKKKRLNSLSSSFLLPMPATWPASWRWQLSVITDWRQKEGEGVGRSDQEVKTSVSLISYPASPSSSTF